MHVPSDASSDHTSHSPAAVPGGDGAGAPRVGIVVPVYNTGAYLRDALDSALAQSIPVEIVVVDDASTDAETLAILRKFAARPKLRFIRHDENRGLPEALNTGIAAMSAPYVFLLGSDDIVDPTYAEESAAILDREPRVSIVTTALRRFGASSELYDPGGAPNGVVDLLIQNTIPGISVCRRADWAAVGGYRNYSWSEDWDFWIRVLSLGGTCVVLPEPRYHWRVHAAQITSTRTWQDKLEQQVAMVRANPGPWIEHLPLVVENLWYHHLSPAQTWHGKWSRRLRVRARGLRNRWYGR